MSHFVRQDLFYRQNKLGHNSLSFTSLPCFNVIVPTSIGTKSFFRAKTPRVSLHKTLEKLFGDFWKNQHNQIPNTTFSTNNISRYHHSTHTLASQQPQQQQQEHTDGHYHIHTHTYIHTCTSNKFRYRASSPTVIKHSRQHRSVRPSMSLLAETEGLYRIY